jgi:hypothetical protein
VRMEQSRQCRSCKKHKCVAFINKRCACYRYLSHSEMESEEYLCLINLSFNLAGFFVGILLFYIQHLPCFVGFQCIHGGDVEVWRKNTLYRFIQGQPHFGIPRRAKMSSTLNKPEAVALHSNPHTTSEDAPEVEFFLFICYA